MEASWDSLPKEDIDSATTQRMLGRLAAKTYDGANKASGKTAAIRWLLPSSIAASVLIFLAGHFFWSHYSKQPGGILPGINSPSLVINNTVDTANNTDNAISLTLSDSSKVTLYPKSRLRYFKDIAATNSRALHLDGKAFFDVAKNQDKPFTVYTGIISTTALGTSFTVNKQNGMVHVRLQTGKVRVEKETSSLPGWDKDIVLMPGQGVSYDSVHLLAKLDLNPKTATGKTANHRAFADTPDLDFKNAPVTEVIDILRLRYHSTIEYKAADLKGMYFTGMVRPSDSLASVLDMIGKLNGLKITKTFNGYRIE